MKKILFVTDLNEQFLTFEMLNNVIPLDELSLEEISFLQIYPLDNWSKELSSLNLKPVTLIKKKIKSSYIIHLAKKLNPDIIILNYWEKPGTYFIRRLINKSTTPILFVKQKNSKIPTNNKNIFSHIVFATDWSQGSEKALNFLLTFKNLLGEMEIVNVINKKLTIKDMRELKERIAKTRKICLNQKIDAEAHIYAGKTADEIMLAAKDYKSTIIVIGSSSKEKSVRKYFKISSSYIVTEKSNLPVLVIP